MSVLDELGLLFNPFDPVASGPPVSGTLFAPAAVEQKLRERLQAQRDAAGAKLTVIEGEYGSGKTYCLRWLEGEVFPELNVRRFSFRIRESSSTISPTVGFA